MGLSIIVGGDVVPSFNNLDAFSKGDIKRIIDEECAELLRCADYRVYNLETPITDVEDPIKKEGANFRVPESAVKGIGLLKPDFIGLANNHCKDQGERGLLDTVRVLIENGITPFGYGKQGAEVCQTVSIKHDGIKVALIACAETEFTIYSKNEYGAIPYHDYWTNNAIKNAKETHEVVIVLYHGGKEYYQYAPPYLQDRCRLMVECGADYVFCQHSHCVCCSEQYLGATILYGQGNFIFRQRNNKPMTKEGLLVKINIKSDSRELEYLPVYMDDSDKVCLMKGQKKEHLMHQFMERGMLMQEPGNVINKYRELANAKAEGNLARMMSSSKTLRLFSRALRKAGGTLYNTEAKIQILNLLQNESHRELFMQYLREEIGQ